MNTIAKKKYLKGCKNHRQAFFNKLAPNSLAIVVANPEQVRNGDVHYEYRQNSDVLYLSGFQEPESVLVFSTLNERNEFMMFVRPKDQSKEIWTGKRNGTDNAVKVYGADKASVIDDLTTVLGPMLKTASSVYYTFGINADLDKKFKLLWNITKNPLFNVAEVISELRVVKSHDEIEFMRKAAQISAMAHSKAMQASQVGATEYELQATLEYNFKHAGGTGLAYGSIVAAGNNACTLHYESNSDTLQNGDLVLIDAACEVEGYAADITRTFPVNGKFTKPQRDIYDLVLKAQLSAISMCKPGNTIQSVHAKAAQVLENGLMKLGILKPANKKPVDKKSAKATTKLTDFFMHGTSHYIGLDVHDVGSYKNPNLANEATKNRVLIPGMAITVEPGLYFDQADTRVPAKYRGIGIRIEDDVLITDTGSDVLSKDVPKTVTEIEALMKS